MDVLYLGPYRQSDSWGSSSRSFLESIISVKDFEVCSRPLFMGSTPVHSLTPKILMAESKKKAKYDVLVQHCLPSYSVYHGDFSKNVIITSFETANCKAGINNLNLLDVIAVQTEAEKQAAPKEVRDKVIPIGFSTHVDNDNTQKNFVVSGKKGADFIFYAFAGGLEERTGIKELLLSYMLAFHLNDNVTLVIQTSNMQGLNDMIQDISQKIGIYEKAYYPKIHLVTDGSNLHKEGNCFVDCSKTFGMSDNVASALINNASPIVLQGSGKDEYVTAENGFIVKSNRTRVLCKERPMPQMFCSSETYLEANVDCLIETMHLSYKDKLRHMKKTCDESLLDIISPQRQANNLKELICS